MERYIHVLGLVDNVDVGLDGDRRLALAGRRVVGAQLAVCRAHHLPAATGRSDGGQKESEEIRTR